MAKAILICGKICSGKTFYAKLLMAENKAVLLSVDEITLALFGQHIGEKHDEIVEKTQIFLFEKAKEILNADITVILDWGFWTDDERQYATNYFTDNGIETEWHYIDVSDDIWHQNLKKRNSRISSGKESFYYIDDGIAAKFNRIFEMPNQSEMDSWIENRWNEELI
jgi:predicted kinase